MAAEPTMTCDACGLVRVVTKSPEATRRWFTKNHKIDPRTGEPCNGKPRYQAGFDVSGFARRVNRPYDHG